jgi:hypothetical protein
LPGIIQLIFAPGIHLVAVALGDMMSMGRLLKDTSLADAPFLNSGIAKGRSADQTLNCRSLPFEVHTPVLFKHG